MAIYKQDFLQHIPIYSETETDNRDNWYINRSLCEGNCHWGVPIKQGQTVILTFRRENVLNELDFSGSGSNGSIEILCFDGSEAESVSVFLIENWQKVFIEDGNLFELITLKIMLKSTLPCGIRYFKITDDENELVWYSDLINVFPVNEEMHLLKIGAKCKIGDIPFEKITGNSEFPIEGYDVYLEPEVLIGDPEYITDESFLENGNSDEIPLFKREDKRYKFNTGLVPEFYSEFLQCARGTTDGNGNPGTRIILKDDENEYTISRIENEIVTDGDGCYLDNEFSFILDTRIITGCCDAEEIPCVEPLRVVSKQKKQNAAEADSPSIGDIYVVRSDADTLPGSNPEWQFHENEYATWNGTGWDYSIPEIRDIIFDVDNSSEWIFSGSDWFDGIFNISNISDLGACQLKIFGLIPIGTFAKIEISTDLVTWGPYGENIYRSSDELLLGYAPPGLLFPGIKYFRLSPLDTNECQYNFSNYLLYDCTFNN